MLPARTQKLLALLTFVASLGVPGGLLPEAQADTSKALAVTGPSGLADTAEAAPVSRSSDPAAAARIPRKFLEASSGTGFVGRAVDIFGNGNGKVYTTNWLNVRVRPFFEEWKWEAIGFHVGLHQSTDMLKNTACRATGGAVGYRYCSTNQAEFSEGAYFAAFYSGIQAELIEFFSREPRPAQVYIGGGASMIQSVTINPMFVPYSSLEFGYALKTHLFARAGFFVALPKDANTFGVAAPEVSLLYLF